MAKAPNFPHPGKLALYEKLIATNPEIERKGATVPYTAVNGNTSAAPPPLPTVCQCAILAVHKVPLLGT